MIDPSELSQWESAITELFEITNDNVGCPEPDDRIFCIRGLTRDQCESTTFYELVEEAGDSGINTVPFCREYDISTFQIFLKGYLMLRNNPRRPEDTNASCLFLEVVTIIHNNRPLTWWDEEHNSYRRFLMYVLMIGCTHNDQIVLDWFRRDDSVRSDFLNAIHPIGIHITLKFLEIGEFHSYTTDSFSKLIDFILGFSMERGRQLVLQYVQKVFSSRQIDVAFAGLSI